MTIISAAMLLFLVMDPLGNIPFFITALKYVEPSRQKKVVARELLIAFLALVFFLFAGRYILQLLSISEPALTIAGGVILFFASGLRQYLGQKGLIALERLMGMVLTTVAIQMLLTGLRVALAEFAPAGR